MSHRPVLVLAGLVVLLTGCQVRTTVDISAGTNGAGSITVQSEMDPAAAAAAPDLARQLDTGDLKTAGWEVTGPQKQSDGDTVVKIRHGFVSPAEANKLMADLTGPSGPFQNFHLTQKRSISAVQTQFTGRVDLTKGIESFGNDTLAKRFGNSLGFDPNEVQTNLGVNWSQTFPVDVVVHIPDGSARAIAPTPGENGVWHIPYGAVTNLQATGKGTNVLPLVYLVIAALFVVAAIAVAVLWKSGRYRPRHRDGGMRARDLLALTEGSAESSEL